MISWVEMHFSSNPEVNSGEFWVFYLLLLLPVPGCSRRQETGEDTGPNLARRRGCTGVWASFPWCLEGTVCPLSRSPAWPARCPRPPAGGMSRSDPRFACGIRARPGSAPTATGARLIDSPAAWPLPVNMRAQRGHGHGACVVLCCVVLLRIWDLHAVASLARSYYGCRMWCVCLPRFHGGWAAKYP